MQLGYVIIECQKHDDYQESLRWLLGHLEEYAEHGRTVAEHGKDSGNPLTSVCYFVFFFPCFAYHVFSIIGPRFETCDDGAAYPAGTLRERQEHGHRCGCWARAHR